MTRDIKSTHSRCHFQSIYCMLKLVFHTSSIVMNTKFTMNRIGNFAFQKRADSMGFSAFSVKNGTAFCVIARCQDLDSILQKSAEFADFP